MLVAIQEEYMIMNKYISTYTVSSQNLFLKKKNSKN